MSFYSLFSGGFVIPLSSSSSLHVCLCELIILCDDMLWLPYLYLLCIYCMFDFPGSSDGKSVCLHCGRPGFHPCVGKILWRRKWQPIPVLLPRKSHAWRSIVSYSPWGPKESFSFWFPHGLYKTSNKYNNIFQGDNNLTTQHSKTTILLPYCPHFMFWYDNLYLLYYVSINKLL